MLRNITTKTQKKQKLRLSQPAHTYRRRSAWPCDWAWAPSISGTRTRPRRAAGRTWRAASTCWSCRRSETETSRRQWTPPCRPPVCVRPSSSPTTPGKATGQASQLNCGGLYLCLFLSALIGKLLPPKCVRGCDRFPEWVRTLKMCLRVSGWGYRRGIEDGKYSRSSFRIGKNGEKFNCILIKMIVNETMLVDMITNKRVAKGYLGKYAI